MTDGGVLQTWKDYQVYFGGIDVKTVKARLGSLGIRIPKRGAPMVRKEVLDKRVDEKAMR